MSKLKRIPHPHLTVEEAECYYRQFPKPTNDEDDDMAIEALQDRYRNYERTKVTRTDGSVAWVRDNGDRLAKAMRPLVAADLKKVAKENDLQDKYKEYEKKLNPGQIRMALGQTLRYRIAAGESKVTVMGKTIKTL